MPVHSTELQTATCSVPECESERTVAGKLGAVQRELTKEGWAFGGLCFSGNDYDLCPTHHNELRAYFGFDELPVGQYPNEGGDIKVEA